MRLQQEVQIQTQRLGQRKRNFSHLCCFRSLWLEIRMEMLVALKRVPHVGKGDLEEKKKQKERK